LVREAEMNRSLVFGVVAALRILLQAESSHAEGPASQHEFKVFVSADMEGVAGVVLDKQTGKEGSDYSQFRAFMTAEVNAAVEAAFASGATEVVVTDGHGSGTNLLPGSLDRRVVLISGFPLPLGMMTGLDETFAAAILIGAHAHASDAPAVLGHTYTNALKEVRLNGQEVGECGLSAALAGHYGVPVVFVSGDQTVAAEARRLIPGVETVAVKEALGRTAARLLDPEIARQRIGLGVRSGLGRLREIRPLRMTTPVTLEVELGNTAEAESVSLVPGVKRTGGRVVSYAAPDMLAAYRVSMLVERLAGE
jgi:D-amino peptidase